MEHQGFGPGGRPRPPDVIRENQRKQLQPEGSQQSEAGIACDLAVSVSMVRQISLFLMHFLHWEYFSSFSASSQADHSSLGVQQPWLPELETSK